MGNTYLHDGSGRYPFGTLECTRCGAVSPPIHGRIEADALVRRIEAFDAEHTACPALHTSDPGDENDSNRSASARRGACFTLAFQSNAQP